MIINTYILNHVYKVLISVTFLCPLFIIRETNIFFKLVPWPVLSRTAEQWLTPATHTA